MKIAVVGCGAVGSFYGGKLAQGGHEVHFLLRSDYEVVRRQGVVIDSPQGTIRVQPQAAAEPEQIGPSDLVLIGLKTTANAEMRRLLTPLVGPGTAILTLQNGLGNEEDLARCFPAEQILGGLCFVCLNRVAPGRIRHIGHGLIMLGEYQRPSQARTHEIAASFRSVGVPCEVTDNLARAHWEKLTWNIPFNGLGVAGTAGFEAVAAGRVAAGTRLRQECLATDELLRDANWAGLVRELMGEVMAGARALGHEIPASIIETQMDRTRPMGAYKASTLLDFERGLPLELNSLFYEPLRQARDAGVELPRLEKLCGVLSQLEARRGGQDG